MMQILNFSLVIVADSINAQQFHFDDFDFPGFKAEETVRMGPLLQIQAGPFTVVVLPDRVQLLANLPVEESAAVECVQRNAETVIEIIGRRTATSMGLNVSAASAPGTAGGFDWIARLVAQTELEEALGLSLDGKAEVTLSLSGSDATDCHLKVGMDPANKRLMAEVNYHYDLAKNIKTPRPKNVIDRLPTAVQGGTELVTRLGSFISQERQPQ